MARNSNSRRLDDVYPRPEPPNLSVVGGTHSVSFDDDSMRVEHPDGSVSFKFGSKQPESAPEKKGHKANLAKEMSDEALGQLASDLLDGIQRDNASRKDWLDTRAMGITLLGLKIEKPRSDAGSTSAPLEGMATIRHPLLLDATVNFQATARAELLPASGPVKVRNDAPVPPADVLQETSASQNLADSMESHDELGNALEKDMNHYLTVIAKEYIPDTDRMLFYIGFGGDGFKKVYNCPLRRRPVSESVDAEDLIVSNAATELSNCARVTHHIKMRYSIVRRMQILGVYRDVELARPSTPLVTQVDKKKEEISGHTASQQQPEDRDYDIYECYCELDLDEFAPKKLQGKGLPLPYRVTLERESRAVLDVRRNWDEDDEECMAKQFFVQFPFIRGLGFYGLGFIHLLGNTTNTLTAAWRLIIDAGMYGNFPAFIYAKGAGRQNTNQFRAPPGGGIGLDIGAQASLKDAIMPLPYKEAGAGLTNFITHVEDVGRKLASTANINVGEGKQDAPVGTTLALIEQASKVMDSAHKRLHASQAEEFGLLKERFKEDPEAFWRFNKKPTIAWEKEQFLAALENCNLVPVADPNNPTSLHRIAKAMAIKTLQQGSPELYDPIAVDMRVMRIVDIDPTGLFRPTPAAPPPDPRMVAVQAKAQAEDQKNQIAQLEAQIKAQSAQATMADKAQDRASREKIEQMKIQLQVLKLKQEEVIHAHDAQRDAAMAQHEMQLDQVQKAHDLHLDSVSRAHEQQADNQQRQHEMQADRMQSQHELRGGIVKTAQEIEMEQERHRAQMQRDRELHEMKMTQAKEKHEQELETAKQLAKIQAAKPAKPAKKAK